MTAALTHAEVRDLLPGAALEILDSTELHQALAHVHDCEDCRRLLDEYRDVAASLATLLPQRSIDPVRSAALRNRLLARAQGRRADTAGATHSKIDASPRRRVAAAVADRWAGWTLAAGLAGVLLVHHAVHRPLANGWLAAGVLALALVALGVYARTQSNRASSLQRRVADLESRRPSESKSAGPPGTEI